MLLTLTTAHSPQEDNQNKNHNQQQKDDNDINNMKSCHVTR